MTDKAVRCPECDSDWTATADVVARSKEVKLGYCVVCESTWVEASDDE